MNAIEDLRDIINDFESDNLINWRVKEDIMRWIDRIEAEYMELPRDKNGRVIHVGDTIRGYSGSEGKVIALEDSGDVIINMSDYNATVTADTFTLVKPDSMERIKADALKGYNYYWNCPDVCPKDCRGRDKYPEVSCMTAKTLDLIARTEKVLGGDPDSEPMTYTDKKYGYTIVANCNEGEHR